MMFRPRYSAGRALRFALVVSAVTCLVATGVAPSSAARSKTLFLEDCRQQTALFPIPREQAERFVPRPFEPSGSPADRPEVVNFYVSSLVCGDVADPRLELAYTYVHVDAPARYTAAHRNGHFYLLDAGVEGRQAGAVRRTTCMGNFLRNAAIELTNHREESAVGPHAAATATSIDSDFLAGRFVVTGEGSPTPMRDTARWFFGSGRSTRYFDADYGLVGWGIGGATVAFTSPYRDLPAASPAFGVLTRADVTLIPAGRCRPR